MSEFTSRIDFLLQENNMRRADLCRATGIPESSIRAWAKQASIPNADYAIKVAHFFGVSVEWLITGENEENEIKLVLDPEEKELIQIFRQLSKENKEFILNSTRFMLAQKRSSNGELMVAEPGMEYTKK